jgi:hypothetical protein
VQQLEPGPHARRQWPLPGQASKQAIAIWRVMPVLKKELLALGGWAQKLFFDM